VVCGPCPRVTLAFPEDDTARDLSNPHLWENILSRQSRVAIHYFTKDPKALSYFFTKAFITDEAPVGISPLPPLGRPAGHVTFARCFPTGPWDLCWARSFSVSWLPPQLTWVAMGSVRPRVSLLTGSPALSPVGSTVPLLESGDEGNLVFPYPRLCSPTPLAGGVKGRPALRLPQNAY
jgi:hypothetical protein